MVYRARSRSRSRGGFRRFSRRPKSDLLPLSDCNDIFAIISQPEADCTDDLQQPSSSAILYPGLMGRVPGTIPSQDRQFQKLSKGYKFKGMRFQLSITAPLELSAAVDYTYTMDIRCAWILVNLDPITAAPLEFPTFNLFTTSELDKADILWRESFTLDFRGRSTLAMFHQLESRTAQRDPTFVIRTKRNVPEDKALLFVMQAYNLFGAPLSVNLELFGYAAVQNWR